MSVGEVVERLQVSDSARVSCPECSVDRRKRGDKDLAIHSKDNGWAYFCHHCGTSGFVSNNWRGKVEKLNRKVEAKPMPPIAMSTLGAEHLAFLKSRGISPETAKHFGLFGSDKFFSRLNKQVAAIGFPYYRDGKLTAAKYRAIESKDFTQDAGGAQDFFGLDHVDPTKPLIIVEGEIDALTAYEAGIGNVVSVPSGAPMKVTNGRIDPSEDKKFSFVWNSNDLIKEVPYVVIATDSDTAGQALAEELARRIGKAKCRLVDIELKDFNEVFLAEGEDAVQALIDTARPYPLEGLNRASTYFDQLKEIWDKGDSKGVSTGFSNLDRLYTVATGQLCVVTGNPSCGKSNLIDQLMINIGKSDDWKFAVCSFENTPQEHVKKLAEIYTKRSYDKSAQRMTVQERDEAFAWIDEHFIFLTSETVTSFTIESILERARVAVAQFGIRGLVIDPYNYIINEKRDMSETAFISDMLTHVQAFAKETNVHVWVVAHPAKMPRGGMELPRPDGMAISGSMAWWAKADVGLTVHRTPTNESEVAIWKCRARWVGSQGETKLVYNKVSGSFTEPVYDFV
jgi:twinkle protein